MPAAARGVYAGCGRGGSWQAFSLPQARLGAPARPVPGRKSRPPLIKLMSSPDKPERPLYGTFGLTAVFILFELRGVYLRVKAAFI